MTEEQILNLAPDAASIKAAKGLTKVQKWPLLGYSERVLFGQCQGSGSKPYTTMIDLSSIAYKCSCPSRKFPCKHALALLLLHANSQSSFTESKVGEEPQFVIDWLDKREANAEKKAKKAAEKASKPVDEKAKAKREKARNQKVLDGISDLKLFLEDTIRVGILDFENRKRSFEELSARMIDAQAPGLAYNLTKIANIYCDSSNKWQTKALTEISSLYLLANSYLNIDKLSPDWQEEIRSRIGFNINKEDIIYGNSSKVTDTWIALYRSADYTNAKVPAFIHTFMGLNSKIFCNVIYYMQEPPVIMGSLIKTTMHFYPGAGEFRRAIYEPEKIEILKDFIEIASYTPNVNECTIVQALEVVDKDSKDAANPPILQSNLVPSGEHLGISDNFKTALSKTATYLAHNPFLKYIPIVVSNCRFAFQGDILFVVDKDGFALQVIEGSDLIYTKMVLCNTNFVFTASGFIHDDKFALRSIQNKQEFIEYAADAATNSTIEG